jgi:hypothetical protein
MKKLIENIIDDNINYMVMINDDYISSIHKSFTLNYFKNQAKLTIKLFILFYELLKHKPFKNKICISKSLFVSCSLNNSSVLISLIKALKLKKNIITYEYYDKGSSAFILIDLLNSFFSMIIHPFILPIIFPKRYWLRASVFSGIIAKSIVSSITINLIKLKKYQNIYFSNDHYYFTRQLIKKANKQNIDTIFVPNGQLNESFPKPIVKKIFFDNNYSKRILINHFNIIPEKLVSIGYPHLLNYKKNVIFNYGICSTPSMSEEGILYILEQLSKENKLLFRPHPAVYKNSQKFILNENVFLSNPFVEDIKSFFEKVGKIITGNSGILFESIFLKKTTFIWNEHSFNKYGLSNDDDRYKVVKNKLCLKINRNNFNEVIGKNLLLNAKRYEELFPIGINQIPNV